MTYNFIHRYIMSLINDNIGCRIVYECDTSMC